MDAGGTQGGSTQPGRNLYNKWTGRSVCVVIAQSRRRKQFRRQRCIVTCVQRHKPKRRASAGDSTIDMCLQASYVSTCTVRKNNARRSKKSQTRTKREKKSIDQVTNACDIYLTTWRGKRRNEASCAQCIDVCRHTVLKQSTMSMSSYIFSFHSLPVPHSPSLALTCQFQRHHCHCPSAPQPSSHSSVVSTQSSWLHGEPPTLRSYPSLRFPLVQSVHR